MEIIRKSNSDSIKENANLNAMLKEKESIIKSLEEALEPDTSDAEEEVVIMNKNTSGHKFTACNKKYSTNTDLESHMDEMHGEAECVFCSKIFQNKKQLKAHVNNCIENGTAKVNCKKCDQTFTRFGLDRHRSLCHKNTRNFKCNECGLLGNTENEIKKHMKNDHEKFQEVSKEVCYHYKRGNCLRVTDVGIVMWVTKKQTVQASQAQQVHRRQPALEEKAAPGWQEVRAGISTGV